MITIDLIDEHNLTIERPDQRQQKIGRRMNFGLLDRAFTSALGQQNDLLRAAHNARLLKLARKGGTSIDVHRFLERCQSGVHTLTERYLSRLG
jgi:hypothetical protein